MGITQQGRYSQPRCHDLCQERTVAIAHQHMGMLTLAKVCNECESFARMQREVGREDFRFTFECLFQRLGRYATARCKETVEEKDFCSSHCSFWRCFSIQLQYHSCFFCSIISCYVDTVKSHLLALLYFPLNIFCSFSKLYKKCISMGESAECVHFLLYLLPDGRCSFSARKPPV